MEGMILTDEMNEVMQLVQNTSDNVFVTGKAGTGKTTFLKHLINNCKKRCVVAAPTGIAAINAGGVTLHSLFGIPFGPISPVDRLDNRFSEFKTAMLLRLELLIIDEISMVRPDIIDTIDRKLRWVRCIDEPFGGVQVVMFGDLFQLPPVVKKAENEILGRFYDDFYFFNAQVWKRIGFHVIELSRIFRQTDGEFVDVLNNIRTYQATSDELDILSEIKDKETSESYTGEYIHLCTHKATVDKINKSLLGEPTWTNEAQIKDKFPESSAPCDLTLQLRVGARVMALCNNSEKGYHNGMLGFVTALSPTEVKVQMDNGCAVKFEPYTWANTQYALKDDQIVSEEIGSCTQFPLTLAWAITIHKSQGLTFDKVILHVAHTFCPGQLYVALSRCRTLNGIVSDAYITKRMIIPEYALIDFERTYKADNNWYGRRAKK